MRYERGGMVEQYVARPRSTEQQFLIPRPMELNGGDLVIEGAIGSGGVFEKHPDGWLWRSKGGVVSLGGVDVHDAKGETIPTVMKVTASKTRIVVDGKALAYAVYPVTIDPEVGANDFRISDMGPDWDAGHEAKEEGLYKIEDTYFLSNLLVYLISFLSLRRWSLRGYEREKAVDLLMEHIQRMLRPGEKG